MDNNNENDDDKMDEQDQNAIDHLLKVITVRKHNSFVWMWLFFRRFLFLVWNFTPMIVLAPLAYLNVFGIRNYWLDLTARSFASGGCTFIKLAQWMSMRYDIFPVEICDAFSQLRMRSPVHSFEDTCKVIEDAYNKPIDEIFDSFYIEPCASGSIAQVYKAQICINPEESGNYFNDSMYKQDLSLTDWLWNVFLLRKNIKKDKLETPKYLNVAVKVRHPQILENMYLDITTMYFLSNFVSSIPGFKGLKFPFEQKTFTQYLESQIDLSYEQHSLKKMIRNFCQPDDDNVIIPRPIDELCTPSVLVETWEHGVALDQLDLKKLTPECRNTIARNCYDVFMKMALRDNFVHGDCHSGNILICAEDVTDDAHKNDDKRDIDGKLVFLDAGLTASLTKEGHKALGVMMGSIASANCRKAAQVLGTWCIMDERNDPQCYNRRDRFVDGLTDIIESSLQWRHNDKNGNPIENKGIPKIQIAGLLRNVLILTQREHITLDASFAAIIASLGIIEGLIQQLDPSADFLLWGVPYLIKYRKLDTLRYLLNS